MSLEAIRCLKRRISDAIFRQLLEDAGRHDVGDVGTGPGGHCRATQESSAVDLPSAPHAQTSGLTTEGSRTHQASRCLCELNRSNSAMLPAASDAPNYKSPRAR